MFLSKFAKKKNDRETYIVCGLGNPGAQYEQTRHNAGFAVLFYIAKQRGFQITKLKNNALYAECDIDGKRVLFILPQTYMNNSGTAVSAFARFYKVDPSHVIVISDDVTLDPGVLRIRKSGTEGGHNGLKSITQHLGSNAYPRMRVGVGKKPDQYDMVDWVLGKVTKEDIEKIAVAADKINRALPLMLEGNIDLAMSKYNG